MQEVTTTAAVGKRDWVEQIAERLRRAVDQVYEAGGSAGRQLKDVMHGSWLGHPFHAVLTSIPIGAWTAAMVLDAVAASTNDRGSARAADTAIAVGLTGAVGASITGLTDWSETTGHAKRLGLLHGLINLTALSLYATSFGLRRSGARQAGRAASAAGFLVACGAGYLGGTLVFREGVGVKREELKAPNAR